MAKISLLYLENASQIAIFMITEYLLKNSSFNLCLMTPKIRLEIHAH